LHQARLLSEGKSVTFKETLNVTPVSCSQQDGNRGVETPYLTHGKMGQIWRGSGRQYRPRSYS